MKKIKPKVFMMDVDGVLTTGNFFYDLNGKIMKLFGPDDHDALLLLKKHIEIIFVTGDKKGYAISEKRIVKDMKMELYPVSTIDRVKWISKKYNLEEVIYMGDGIFDDKVFKAVGYSIATADAFYKTKILADFVTHCTGGNRAVAEATLHILEKFFPNYDKGMKLSAGDGEWGQ